MTTLGFSGIDANVHDLLRGSFGHVLLTFNVLFGYIFLGALVTRFGILFTGGGPISNLTDESKKKFAEIKE